jgi:sugar/nucleoside kinase (ribokinase family)
VRRVDHGSRAVAHREPRRGEQVQSGALGDPGGEGRHRRRAHLLLVGLLPHRVAAEFPSCRRPAAAAAEKKIVAVNLAAPFIPSFFSEPLLASIRVSDFVFGNESEAEAFAAQQKLEKNDAETVARYIAALPQQDGASRPRTVVITQGAHCTVVCVNGEVSKFDVPALAKELIVDANGAGDAFVGGFLVRFSSRRIASVRGRSPHIERIIRNFHRSCDRMRRDRRLLRAHAHSRSHVCLCV